jgi:internalin A
MDCDIIYCILCFLNPKNILSCSSINKQFNTTSKSELIWKQFCDRDYKNIIMDNYCINYKKYKILHRFVGLNMYSNNVISLDKSYSGLESIPSEIGLLTNLELLYLSNNRLRSIPVEMCTLTNLRYLDLDRNKLQFMPNEIGLLTNLKQLKLSENYLRSVPKEIGSLLKLKSLHVCENKLKSVPQEIGLLTSLLTLELHSNKLQSIPHLPISLSCLALNYNQLESIEGMTKSINLRFVYACNNKLKSIPKEIGLLTNLRDLYLSSNQLQSIPSELVSLPNLSELSIHSNDLESIAQGIWSSNLNHIFLDTSQKHLIRKTNIKIVYIKKNDNNT